MQYDDPDTFSIRVESTSKSVPKLRLALELNISNKVSRYDHKDNWEIFPLTWFGKPTCDKTKTFWNWGFLRFHERNVDKMDIVYGKDGPPGWKWYRQCDGNDRIRLIYFIVA